jgi:hypothetical protein
MLDKLIDVIIGEFPPQLFCPVAHIDIAKFARANKTVQRFD